MEDEYFVGEKRFETPTGISPTGKGVNECGREQFESWISSDPYDESIERVPGDEKAYMPRVYRSLKVNLAWAAWQESRRTNDRGNNDRPEDS